MLMFGSLSCDLRNSLDPHSRGVDRVNANTQIGAQKDREVVLGFNAANTNGMLRGSDIDRLNAPFLAVFKSLVPAEEEKAKQKQLLTSLEKLVNKEWPNALLYLYGSCANSFGVSKSDIDVCLAIEETDITKSEILLKLAELLESDNLENVQEMETTYAVTVDGIECVFFDKVENLRDFGARNKENRATCVGIL